jgi:hypothetical protein
MDMRPLILIALLAAPAHAREWIGAWIPYAARSTIEAQWQELQRVLRTPDDKLTPEERRIKREWQRK